MMRMWKCASDGEKEVVPETVSGFLIGFLTAKGLESGPTHFFIFPILHFLSYEFLHFHCPRFHSLSLSLLSFLLFRLFLHRQTRRWSYTKRHHSSWDTSTLFCHTHLGMAIGRVRARFYYNRTRPAGWNPWPEPSPFIKWIFYLGAPRAPSI